MRPKAIQELLRAIVKQEWRHTPIHVWGAPGIGKSDTVRGVAKDLGIGLVDVRMALLDPTDLRGIPIPREGRAEWLPPTFLPDVRRDGERGLLFLDELNASPPLVQVSGYQLTLDRRIGEYRLPDGWAIVAAGNRQGDRAVVNRMPSALANRFIHIDFEVNLDDWTEWAMGHDIDPSVIGFIRFRPELLFAFDPKRDERAFPTPRSWSYTSRLVSLPADLAGSAIAGAVGEAAAAEFLGYLRVVKDLPDIQKILDGDNKVPKNKDAKYACICAVAARAEERHLEHLLEYGMKYDEPEFGVLLVQLLKVRFRQELPKQKSFMPFVKKYRNLILD